MEYDVRRMLRQIFLDLRLAGVTHLPRHLLPEVSPTRGTPGRSQDRAKGAEGAASTSARAGASITPASPIRGREAEKSESGPLSTPLSGIVPSRTPASGQVISFSQRESQARAEAAGTTRQASGGQKPGGLAFSSKLDLDPSGGFFAPLTVPEWAQDVAAAPVSREEKIRRLSELQSRVARCTRCPELVRNRTQTVFSDGDPESRLVFVGEAPGADEDRQGVPFVGRAGQLLTDIITKGMGLKRQDVYICNVIKCRPPENRTPTPTEVANCRDYLDEQLSIIRPQFVCCLGSVAAQRILGSKQSMTRLRGQVFQLGRVKVVCTYHPAYLLRNPAAKRETWEDIKLLMREMGLNLPPPRSR